MALNSTTYSTMLGNAPTVTWSNWAAATVSSSGKIPSTTFGDNNGTSIMEISSNEKSMKVNGKLVINGEDIDERLTRIEDMLHIPRRDIILEEKYEKLKMLWKEYTDTLDAIKTWETIKESS